MTLPCCNVNVNPLLTYTVTHDFSHARHLMGDRTCSSQSACTYRSLGWHEPDVFFLKLTLSNGYKYLSKLKIISKLNSCGKVWRSGEKGQVDIFRFSVSKYLVLFREQSDYDP